VVLLQLRLCAACSVPDGWRISDQTLALVTVCGSAQSMPILMPRYVGRTVGAYPLVGAEQCGGFGAFLARFQHGFQYECSTSSSFGVAPTWFVSTAVKWCPIQAIGAAAGNMVAIHNVGGVGAVGLPWPRRCTLRRTGMANAVLPC